MLARASSQRYLQLDVATASQEMLVSRLYAKAVQCMQLAKAKRDDPVARTKSLRRSLDIVAELRRSLDFETGEEIAQNLDLLYEYVSERLVEAALAPDDVPIDDALQVLEPLAEAWVQVASERKQETR